MINIDIDVLVNGKPIQISQDLNDLLSDYILRKVGITSRTNILDSISERPTKRFPSAKTYSPEGRQFKDGSGKIGWSDDETLLFTQRVEELRTGGLSFLEISRRLSPEFQNRTPLGLQQKIYQLKKTGLIKIV